MTRMHLVEKIVLRKEGAAPDLFAWLDKHAAFAGTATSTGGFVSSGQTSPQQVGSVKHYWEQGTDRPGALHGFFVHFDVHAHRAHGVRAEADVDHRAVGIAATRVATSRARGRRDPLRETSRPAR